MKTRRSRRSAPAYWPVWQITLNRLREAYRQPETIFWVYGFPVLLIISLGVAFRDRTPELVIVDVQQAPHARAVLDILRRSNRTRPRLGDAADCQRRLRTGRTDIVVVPTGQSPPRYAYGFDPTRPQSILAQHRR